MYVFFLLYIYIYIYIYIYDAQLNAGVDAAGKLAELLPGLHEVRVALH